MNGKYNDASARGANFYRYGIVVAALTAFGIVWTTIVRDDGSGAAYFMIILASLGGGYATRFSADGLSRTMIGVAGMHVVQGLLTATAPITALHADGPFKAMIYNGGFAALWLASSASFRIAARRGPDRS